MITDTVIPTTSRTFNIIELFENNFFYIPDYQRGYSWEKSHLEDLVKDIENISSLNNKHYTGTIIAARKENQSNHYDLVDGQQRLTTLIILLNELYYFDPIKYSEIKELFLVRGSVGREKFVFTPNLETRQCFNEAVMARREFQPSIKSHEAILNAKFFFNEWLNGKLDMLDLVYETLTQKLNFLFFTPGNTKEIGIMFEVINNRGKPLSELEKIKNFFIYYATVHEMDSLREEINLKWRDIQINLSRANRTSNDDENAFLRYCYLIFFETKKDKSWYVYEECKLEFDVKNNNEEFIINKVTKMKEFVHFLSDCSCYYAWFFNSAEFSNAYKSEYKEELGKCLTYLRCQPVNASIMPLYLSIMTRLDRPDQVIRLLELLEIVNMRLYVLPKVFSRADSKQADLFYFAYEFFNDQTWHSDNDPCTTKYNGLQLVGDIFDWLYHNLTQITYAFCGTEKFIENLHLDETDSFDFYRWNGIRYFLACYEEEILTKRAKRSFNIQRILSGKKAVGENFNDQLSLEHIWASKNRENVFGPEFHTKRRLGNFVLCGLSSNTSLSNKDISEKIKELIVDNGVGDGALDMLQIAELHKIHESVIGEIDMKRQTKNYWKAIAEGICNDREEAFVKFALKRWILPNEKVPAKE